MLAQDWEGYATTLANADGELLVQEYEKLVNEEIYDRFDDRSKRKPKVIFGRDTRASGPSLVKALKAALDALHVDHTDFGILTTPQLHYLVRSINTYDKGPEKSFGEPTEAAYYIKMATAFRKIMKDRNPIKGAVTVDCANGVGGPKLRELLKHLPTSSEGGIDIKVANDDTLNHDILNKDCGADYVKTKQRLPPSISPQPLERCCSLDGDADRLVYYYADASNNFTLLDGDRIATLSAFFLADMIRSAKLESELKVGIVQTAYANGAATEMVEKVLKLPVTCTPTGVKHLHHEAAKYDIGIYFEANGHGTILFSDNAIRTIRDPKRRTTPGVSSALDSLAATVDLVNQTVGDAISDMLFVEVVLAHKQWTVENWKQTYTDLPNRLVRVEVRDRSMFTTTDAERKLLTPTGMQSRIDQAVALYQKGRSFVRASGTEDAVRVYAEAQSKTECERLANEVEKLVKDYGA